MNDNYLISRKRIFNATFIVIIAILLSKISGLARDQIMAGFFGISYETDAFTWAYFIPNLFRVLIAESLIVAAFIPIYSAYLKDDRKKDLSIFVNSIANIMLIIFIFISLIIFIFSPQIGILLSRIANNQLDIAKFIIMNRIMIFSLLTLSLSGLVTGVLNSHNLFTLPSIAPFMLNITTIIFIVALSAKLDIYSMAIGTMAGSLMHLLVQLPHLKVSELKYRFILNFKHQGVREIFSLMFPILLSLGAVQLNNSVDNFFALNLGAGNTTALTLSWRVANLPLGVFSVAVVTVLYPLLSRQAAENDIRGIKESFSLGVREIGYIMVPATMGLVILSFPIIKLLFEHNNFNPDDTSKVSFILIYHSLGLVFFGLLMILNRVFYSFKDIKTPLKIAGISIVLNLVMDWIFVKFMDAAGLAFSTSLVAAINVIMLVVILRKKIGSFGGKRIFNSYYKIFISSSIMGLFVYFLWKYISVFAFDSLLLLTLLLGFTIIAGGAVYVIITILLKMDEARFIFGIFKNYFGKKPKK